mmetsp:Transcript_1358/g.3514  ORF Transcript_1358/g.3514 Transcript_1358/m.3514 type:complete len:211 (-) Transcript_1358:156-788(-)
MLHAFNAASRRRPLAMSTATAFTVVAVGDATVQLLRERRWDPRRSAVPAVYSGALAPVYFVWWRILDMRLPGSGLAAGVSKALLNQFLTSLPNNVGYMAWCTYWLKAPESESAGSMIGTRLRAELPGVIVQAFAFWLPMNVVNFMFMPLHHRILFMSAVNTVWAGWLSNVVNGDKGQRAEGPILIPAMGVCSRAADPKLSDGKAPAVGRS